MACLARGQDGHYRASSEIAVADSVARTPGRFIFPNKDLQLGMTVLQTLKSYL